MRLQLSSVTPPVDTAIIPLSAGTFNASAWLGLGYTQYSVICIGGSGGRGGHAGAYSGDLMTDGGYFLLGGGGGGGGMQIVSGLLSSLPSYVTVTVGAAGTNGANVSDINGVAGNGGAGGSTTFNGTLCRASGGLGGQGANLNLTGGVTHPSQGGNGGIGGTTTAGGGALGAQNGDPATTTRRAGATGAFNQPTGIGAGGGGGAGGLGAVNTSHQPIGWYYKAINGGAGAYPDAQSANGLGTVYAGKKQDPDTNPALLIDGVAESGGGANARIVSGESYVAGTYHANLYTGSFVAKGLCVIKLMP